MRAQNGLSAVAYRRKFNTGFPSCGAPNLDFPFLTADTDPGSISLVSE
jgi:hypothetical protein